MNQKTDPALGVVRRQFHVPRPEQPLRLFSVTWAVAAHVGFRVVSTPSVFVGKFIATLTAPAEGAELRADGGRR